MRRNPVEALPLANRPVVAGQYTRRWLLRRGAASAAAVSIGALGLSLAGCGAGKKGKNASSSGQAGASSTKAPLTKLTVSYLAVPNDVPLFLAKDQGILAKHGLDVTLMQIPGPTSVAALLSGQTQIDHAGGSELLGAAVQGGDVKVVAVTAPRYPLLFITSPDIKTGADLKGKKVGVSQPGGSADFLLRLILPEYGLQPDKDVAFISAGSIENLFAALQSGAIQGTIVVPGHDSLTLQNQGFRVLVDFATTDLASASSVIASTGGFISANRAVVQQYVDAMVEATAIFRKDKNASLQEIAKIYKSDDTTGFNVAYDFYARDSITPLLPTPKPEHFKPILDSLCKKTPQACSYDATKVIDASFVENAASRGLGK